MIQASDMWGSSSGRYVEHGPGPAAAIVGCGRSRIPSRAAGPSGRTIGQNPIFGTSLAPSSASKYSRLSNFNMLAKISVGNDWILLL